jgi:hypothetical protein
MYLCVLNYLLVIVLEEEIKIKKVNESSPFLSQIYHDLTYLCYGIQLKRSIVVFIV